MNDANNVLELKSVMLNCLPIKRSLAGRSVPSLLCVQRAHMLQSRRFTELHQLAATATAQPPSAVVQGESMGVNLAPCGRLLPANL